MIAIFTKCWLNKNVALLTVMSVLLFVLASFTTASAAVVDSEINFEDITAPLTGYANVEAAYPMFKINCGRDIISIQNTAVEGNNTNYAKHNYNSGSDRPSSMSPYLGGRHVLLKVDDNATPTAITSGSYAFKADFAITTTMQHMVALFAPSFTNNNGAPSGEQPPFVYAYNGNLYVGTNATITPETDFQIPDTEYELGQWFNLGGVVNIGSPSTYDIYYNGSKVYTASYAGSYLYKFALAARALPTSPSGAAYQPDLLFDNIYMGRDVSRVYPPLTLVSSNPVDGDAEALPLDKITLTFSVPIASYDDNAFQIDGGLAITDVEYADGTKKALVLELSERLQKQQSYTLTITPNAIESDDGIMLTGNNTVSFTVGNLSGIVSSAEFFSVDDIGEKTPITQITDGRVSAKIKLADYNTGGQVAVIGLVCKGSEQFYRVSSVKTEGVMLVFGEEQEIDMDFDVTNGEFIKILAWQDNENSLINLIQPLELR